MAQELEQTSPFSNIECELIPGSGGIFEVRSSRGLVFSKAKQGRFPRKGEIAALLGNP